MDNKEIQDQRMRGYFIQATKEILKGEGLKGLSVRNIADRAGYSYATLYNYFKDIQELIFLCVQDFQKECEEEINLEVKDMKPGTNRIRAIASSFIGYFIQYPGIFELFYLEKMTDIESNKPVSSLIYSFLTRLCSKDWDYGIEHGSITPEEAESRSEAMNALITGMLLLFLNRRQPAAYADFLRVSSGQLDRLLK